MPTLLAKITLLFLVALTALFAAKRSTAAMRHLLCVCALAGSLILPVITLFPTRVIAIRLPDLILARVPLEVIQNLAAFSIRQRGDACLRHFQLHRLDLLRPHRRGHGRRKERPMAAAAAAHVKLLGGTA